MATITGLTAARMLEIEAASVVDGDVVGNDLILARQDGSIINAGNVRGAVGPAGPMGASLAVVTARDLLEVGQANQIKAGRQLTPADFTNMGLSTPLGLWNLSNFNDSSGNGRTLTNKGSVGLASGILGVASSAAQFTGVNTQVLYIADTGVADPFRISAGSWGCWFRTAKRGTHQWMISKLNQAGTGVGSIFDMTVRSSNVLQADAYNPGGAGAVTIYGTTEVNDDHWHFGVATHDGAWLTIYLDGVFEGRVAWPYALNTTGSGPFNLGGYGADAGNPTNFPHFGRISNAFVTADVLSPEQVRNLYCASIPHALGVVPNVVRLSVRRKKRGAALVTTDFPAQPARLYNFAGGALTDLGANNITLAPGGGGAIYDVPGPDGLANSAKMFTGAHTGLVGTDANLPAAFASRSAGAWFKYSVAAGSGDFLSWGTPLTADFRLGFSGGFVQSASGADGMLSGRLDDGVWHHAVVVEDNMATDAKRKLYIDGELVTTSNVMTSLALVGAARFRVGTASDGTRAYVGAIAKPFVYAGALTAEQVWALYNKGSQALAPSPKSDADHIEAIELGRLLAIFDSIESSDSIDLAVMA